MNVHDYPYRVLVVEDEPVIRDVIREILTDHGFVVLTAASGTEAILLLDNHADEIGVAFIDVDLGHGPDGFDVARHARTTRMDIKVVYTSGGVRSGLLSERVDNSLFVAKPYVAGQVAILLTDALSLQS